MIKGFLVLSLIVSCVFAEIKWAASYNAALASAKKEKKNVMVMLSREGCPACDYMDNIVLEDTDVEDAINKGFIPVHVDIHKDKAVASSLGFIGTPTFHFISSSGKKLNRIDGAVKTLEFLEVLDSIKKP